jgi:hypothetical protein
VTESVAPFIVCSVRVGPVGMDRVGMDRVGIDRVGIDLVSSSPVRQCGDVSMSL